MREKDAKCLLTILDRFTETIKDILHPSLERSKILSILSDYKYRFKKQKRIINETTGVLFKTSQKGKEKVDNDTVVSEDSSDFLNNLIIDTNIDEVYLQTNE